MNNCRKSGSQPGPGNARHSGTDWQVTYIRAECQPAESTFFRYGEGLIENSRREHLGRR